MKTKELISIKGARVHNLKNININIPKNKLVVITGLSGSGKSSLAFDTVYAEGQRRYIESLSAYARQFLGVLDKPDVDSIDGLSPTISIDQKSVSKNPRSTVGTITEIYDYMRVLFAKVGVPHCSQCGGVVKKQPPSRIVENILKYEKGSRIYILASVVYGRKGEYHRVLEEIQRQGFLRVRVDGEIITVKEAVSQKLERYKIHNIEVVVDRLVVESKMDRPRILESVEQALKIGKGVVMVSISTADNQRESASSPIGDHVFSENFICPKCGVSLPEITPRLFSFNSPYGACRSCSGLGKKMEAVPELIISNKNLTLAEGALKPWGGSGSWNFSMIEDLAGRAGFSLNAPVKKLSKKHLDMILYGLKNFEGIVNYLERKWRETDSNWTRREMEKFMTVKICSECKGRKLKPEALGVRILESNIAELSSYSIEDAVSWFKKMDTTKEFGAAERKIFEPLVKEISSRLKFLEDVGLDYLALNRESATLSGGESQRIRLATQIGSKLSGIIYVLDEPSIGLHQRDQKRLIKTLKDLRDLGNTVLVVEHDEQTMREADWIIDIGPGAGEKGGKVIFEGPLSKMLKSKTLTACYLNGEKKIMKRVVSRKNKTEDWLTIVGAKEHNLKDIAVKIPLGKFVCVSGVSGSGKSSLIIDILAKFLSRQFYRAKETPGAHTAVLGAEYLDKVIHIDQSPIGRTPRSNPATYTGAFTIIRDLFAKTREAKVRGYKTGRFSFNVRGGRCESCEGQGVKKIEMHFLPDVYVECSECGGTRYNKEALEILYKEKDIAETLNMSIEEAKVFFKDIPGLFGKLETLDEVGLGYVKLGQSATTLSGGEAQRIKLAAELSKKATGQTLYILDEPTTGLHFDDTARLIAVLGRLVEKGNTVLVIEHNLDVLKCADWIIDLGPEGGEKGGEIVAEGKPEDIMKNKKSYTGKFLLTNFNI